MVLSFGGDRRDGRPLARVLGRDAAVDEIGLIELMPHSQILERIQAADSNAPL